MSDIDRTADDAPVRGRIALAIVLVLTLVGVGASIRLTVVYHEANASLSHKSACAINANWDCDSVARSPYARFLKAPTSLWALGGYLLMVFFAGFGLLRGGPRHWPLGVLTVLVLCAIGMSSYLAYVAIVILKKKCLWCTTLYGVNIALAIGLAAVFVARRVNPLKAIGQDIGYLMDHLAVLGWVSGAGVIGAVVILLAGPQLGRSRAKTPPPTDVGGKIIVPPRHRPGPGRHRPEPLPKGEPAWVGKLVAPHTPARGPKDADLYIVEFSDYECPFCQRSNKVMEKVLAKYGSRIRLYHRHFPLDKTCYKKMRRQMHPSACFAAAAAICAHQQNRFWEMHDALFRLGERINKLAILGLAQKLKLAMGRFRTCVTSARTQKLIQQDLAAGDAIKIDGTPSFVMGGPLIKKFSPPGLQLSMFDQLFAALDKAKKQHAAMTAKDATPMRPATTPRRPTDTPARPAATPMRPAAASPPGRRP